MLFEIGQRCEVAVSKGQAVVVIADIQHFANAFGIPLDETEIAAVGAPTNPGRLDCDAQRVVNRTLDLDLVQYGDPVFDTDVVMASTALTLPHPRAHERAFVLVPWLRIEPEAVLRVAGTVRRVADLVADLDTTGVRPGPDVDLLEGPW